MKNCKGFSLIEVMIALLIFSVVAGTILPAIVTVQRERVSIRQERVAEELVNRAVYEDSVEMGLELINVHGTIYKLSTREQEGKILQCAMWTGRNGRENERCLLKNRME